LTRLLYSITLCAATLRFTRRLPIVPSNNSMPRTALCAAAEPER